MRSHVAIAIALSMVVCSVGGAADDDGTDGSWRSIPLILDGKVADGWEQVGWGGFVVDGDSLRTEADERGMGLLVYIKERLGNCQIRAVFRSKDAKSNAGVFVRVDDGVLDWIAKKPTPVKRNAEGKLPPEMLKIFMDQSAADEGAWYAVHHGYEVQIMDDSDPFHRTGAIYSLAKASRVSPKPPTEWRTMVITLDGDRVLVDIDGQRVTTFDPAASDVPPQKNWPEPRREPKRPEVGFLGLQNHDPGDVVYFKEVSVRPLSATP